MSLIHLAWAGATLLLMPFLGSLYLRGTASLTGGRWYEGIRGMLDVIHRWSWLPLLGLLATAFLYPRFATWMQPLSGHVAELAGHRAPWFNESFILLRGVGYVLVLAGIALLLPRLSARGCRGAGPGLLFLSLVLFAFAVDWLMVRDLRWFSTAFPFLFILLCVLAALALGISGAPLRRLEEGTRRQLASLLQANVLLVGYIGFMEFLIIWMGDLPREAQFYVERGGWVPGATVTVGVALPFLGLLPHEARARPGRLRAAAIAALLGVALHLLWFIDPLHPASGL